MISMDINVKDLQKGDYIFYVRATGDIFQVEHTMETAHVIVIQVLENLTVDKILL